MANYCSIGKFVAAFGVDGTLVLKHNLGKKSSLKQLDTLFIEKVKDEMLPYFIKSISVKNFDELHVKIDGIGTREAARSLLQKQVWLTDEEFQKHAGSSAPISMLGFHIINNNEDIGEILEVIEQPHQVLCRISLDGKEALIPIHAETLQKIDKKNRKVLVTLPDGLLDIFR